MKILLTILFSLGSAAIALGQSIADLPARAESVAHATAGYLENPPTSTDCNRNGIADSCDLSCADLTCTAPDCGGSFDCNHNGIPDECDVSATLPLASGLRIWLRAETITGVEDGQPVPTWKDESGSDLHVTQSNPTEQPTFVQSGPNGRPAVRFNGAQYLKREAVTGSALSSADQATVLFVIKPSVANRNTLVGWGSNSNRFLLHTALFGTLHFQHGNTDAGADLIWSVPPEWQDTLHIVQFYRNGPIAEARVDRTLLPTTQIFPNSLVVTETHPLFIGSDRFGINTMAADVAEIVIYDRALFQSERDAVEAYLCAKYAILPECPSLIHDCNSNGTPDDCEAPLSVNAFVSIVIGANPADACLADMNQDARADGADIQEFIRTRGS